MKRLFFPLCWAQIGIALSVLAIGPGAWATDGPYSGGPAELDFDTGQLFDSQHPNHVVVQGSQTATLSGHGTTTLTSVATHTHTVTDISGTATYTHTHTVTDVEGAVGDTDSRLTDPRSSTNTLYAGTTNVSFSTGTSTATATSANVGANPKIHVATAAQTSTLAFSLPNATKTATVPGTVTFVSTDFATTATGTSNIPLTTNEGKINHRIVPWSYALTVSPNANNTYDLGTTDYKWRNINFAGTLYGGNVSAHTGSFSYIGADLIPDDNAVQDIGSSSYKWKRGYFNETVSAGGGFVGPNLGLVKARSEGYGSSDGTNTAGGGAGSFTAASAYITCPVSLTAHVTAHVSGLHTNSPGYCRVWLVADGTAIAHSGTVAGPLANGTYFAVSPSGHFTCSGSVMVAVAVADTGTAGSTCRVYASSESDYETASIEVAAYE